LKDDDAGAPLRAAHTLKGVAGSIGAIDVAAAAAALESACQQEAPLDELLQALVGALTPVLKAIAEAPLAVAEPAPAAENAEIDTVQGLEQLGSLLENSDPAARELAEQLLTAMREQADVELLTTLLADIEIYDFDAALESFRTLQQR